LLGRFRFINLRGSGHIGDVHCTTTDQSTTAGASAKFCKGHTNGHSVFSLPVASPRPVGINCVGESERATRKRPKLCEQSNRVNPVFLSQDEENGRDSTLGTQAVSKQDGFCRKPSSLVNFQALRRAALCAPNGIAIGAAPNVTDAC
jgi:hypothetical protein